MTYVPVAGRDDRPSRRRARGKVAALAMLVVGATSFVSAVTVHSAFAGPKVTAGGGYAWALADQQSNPGPYSPAAATQYNSQTSSSAVVTRSSVGVYSVRFPGVHEVGSGEGSGGTAFVSGANCKLNGWFDTAGGETLNVLCFREPGILNQGQPADSTFTASYTSRSTGATYPVSFALANLATGSYTPQLAYRYNYGNSVKVTQTATGTYSVVFKGRNATGIPKVTADGSNNVLCNLGQWGANATNSATHIRVLCFDGTGTPANSQFVIQYAQQNALYGDANLNDAGLTSAPSGSSWSYRYLTGFLPSSDYSITQSFTGVYHVTLKAQSPNTHYVYNISTVGTFGRYCSATSPDATAAGDIHVDVSCFNGTHLKNVEFNLEFNAV
jgi:hypothetical protein